MYGGEVCCGPRPGGGFRVQPTLPYFANPTSTETSATNAVPPIAAVAARRRLQPGIWDVVLAAGIVVVSTIEILAYDPVVGGPRYAHTGAWAWLLRIACCLTLAARRRHPNLAYATAWMLGLALTIGDYQVGTIVFVLWIGLYTVASHATPERLVGTVIGTYVGTAVIAWSRPPDLTTPGAVWLGVFLTASAVAGYVAQHERQRRALHLAEREATADGQSRRSELAVAGERLRIADELGTVITRSIRTIATHAATGSQLVDLDPAAAKATLDTISTISRDALNDLRRLLKRIRTESEPVMYSPITPTVDVVSLGDAR